MLSKKQLESVCMYHSSHKCCRYLVYDREGGCYVCCKKVDECKEEIDKRVDVFSAKKDINDLIILGRPIGDNCEGYLFLKNVFQGYDIPGSV